MGFLEELPARAARTGARVVLAEGEDPRMAEAAVRLRREVGLDPIVLLPAGTPRPGGLEDGRVRHPAEDPDLDRYADLYRDLRPAEELSLEAARERASEPLIFAGLMLRAGDADGAVAGASSTTGEVIRAALRCVGTAADVRTVSGAFYMVVPGFRDTREPEVLTFTDAGAVPDPDIDQLVEIADRAAVMRRAIVGDEPRVAFLSYSTRGSADGPSVQKMRAATARFRARHPEVAADGELQVDAALIEAVGARKAPDSPVAGGANVLVFPDLDAGNIAYKLVERLAGAAAIGPILHGLARPYNDLSRGTGVEGVIRVACVTALMADRP